MPGIFHEQNKQQYQRRVSQGRCRKCGKRKPTAGKMLCRPCLKAGTEYYYKNKESRLSYQQVYTKKLRDAAFTAYGGYRCACCGDTHKEFLTIDHVNGDGSKHRRELGRGGHVFLLWLRRNKYPAGFRVLCMNCNFARGVHGYCPHEREKTMSIEKYGVDETVDENLEKKAAEGCPECGKKPERHGNVLMCPTHGSEPFEKQKQK